MDLKRAVLLLGAGVFSVSVQAAKLSEQQSVDGEAAHAKKSGDERVHRFEDRGLSELAGMLRPGFLVGTHSKSEQFGGGKATDIILKNYNMISVGIYQRQTQRRSRTAWDFSAVDPGIAFANRHDIQVYAHPMFGSDGYLPDWLLQGDHSDEECLRIVENRIRTILTRYRGRIQILDVYNEGLERRKRGWRERENLLVRLGYHENEVGRWPVILEIILVWCRKYGGGDLKLIYNDNSNTLQGMPQSDDCIQMVKALRKAGIPIDGIGIQCHTKITVDGRHELGGHERTRPILFDADLFARNLEAMGEAGIDVHISECDVHLYGEIDERKLALQADAYRSILKTCIEAPACKSFKTWGFTDASCWKPMSKGNWSYKYEPCPLVFDHDLKPKPAYRAMQSLLIELIERRRKHD
jgi:endo-1,4-beta-xylanase